MAFEGVKKCAVRDCPLPGDDRANLCAEHVVFGFVFRVDNGTGVVTCWYAEHGGKRGIILMNDFALGDLFDGADGFKAELVRQGFSGIRNLATPAEFASARAEVTGAPGGWIGPWMTEYPWAREP